MLPDTTKDSKTNNSADTIVEYYNNIANDYDYSRFGNSYGKYIDKQERIVLNKLKISPERALDLPCGTGRFLNFADYGCDASEKMLRTAASHWEGKHLVCSDARDLPYEDNTFDTVITMHLLMHLDNDSIRKIMKEVYRVLHPGGRWIVDIPSYKRRKLTNRKESGWHGSNSMSIEGMKEFTSSCFNINSVHGIMLFPVHRIPGILRNSLCGLDYKLSQFAPIKEYCSYLIFELWKS